MDQPQLHILILCTGNSARSILAEAIANKVGNGRLVAWSAGSFPKGQVHPHALALLAERGYETSRFRSKSWDEFAQPDAPPLDMVITVCDNAAGEVCPIWPGGPVRTHWGLPDPAAAEGSDAQIAKAFADTYAALEQRFTALVALHPESMDRDTLKRSLDALAHAPSEPA